jgi:hypothetical protein
MNTIEITCKNGNAQIIGRFSQEAYNDVLDTHGLSLYELFASIFEIEQVATHKNPSWKWGDFANVVVDNRTRTQLIASQCANTGRSYIGSEFKQFGEVAAILDYKLQVIAEHDIRKISITSDAIEM